MIPRHPTSTRPDTLLPYPTLFRSRYRCVLLDHGRLRADGDPAVVAPQYLRLIFAPEGMREAIREEILTGEPVGSGSGDTVPALEIAPDRPPAHEGVEEVQRSEEHTSELQSLMRISYAVFCLKKKKIKNKKELATQTKDTNNIIVEYYILTRHQT